MMQHKHGRGVRRAVKLKYSYDHELDVLTVEGVRYSGDLFRMWSDGGLAVGKLFRIVARSTDGGITLQALDE